MGAPTLYLANQSLFTSDVAMIKPLQCACVQTLLCRFAIYLAWILFTVVFLWRLTLGVDHSDESYYAIAPVSWTRSNPVDTGNLSIHQFSGCITYPLIQAYAWITPSLHGLILFCDACMPLLRSQQPIVLGDSCGITSQALAASLSPCPSPCSFHSDCLPPATTHLGR